jgi:hypothetical protein
MRNARLKREDAFCQAMIIVSSALFRFRQVHSDAGRDVGAAGGFRQRRN